MPDIVARTILFFLRYTWWWISWVWSVEMVSLSTLLRFANSACIVVRNNTSWCCYAVNSTFDHGSLNRKAAFQAAKVFSHQDWPLLFQRVPYMRNQLKLLSIHDDFAPEVWESSGDVQKHCFVVPTISFLNLREPGLMESRLSAV